MLLPSRVVPTTIQINYLTDSTDTFQRGRKRNTPNKIGQRNALVRQEVPETLKRSKRSRRNEETDHTSPSESELPQSESDNDTSAQKPSSRKLRRRTNIKAATRFSPSPIRTQKNKKRAYRARRR